MSVQPLSNPRPRSVQKQVMSRVCRGNVQVLLELCQTCVKLRNTWTEIGQANPEIVESLSTQFQKVQFFPLDKPWTNFGLGKFKLRVHILGF